MNLGRRSVVFVLLLVAGFAGQFAYAQLLDAAGIRDKVEEASKARRASEAAYAENKPDEGRRLLQNAQKLLSEARADFEAIGARHSNDPKLLTDYADLLIGAGDYDLAEQVLLRAVKIDPEDAAIWLKLGQTQAALGPKSESRAIRSLRKAASIEPKTKSTVQANASLGALYQESGLYEFARESYLKAIAQDPEHMGSKLALASLDAREGKMVKANEAYESIESQTTEYAPFIKRTLGPALDGFAQSRRWLPDTAEMHLAYAELLIRADRLEESFWPLNRSLKIDDKNYIAWNLMGSVMRGMNRLKGSREAFMRSLELNPDQPRTREALTELDRQLSESGASGAPAGQAAGDNTTSNPPQASAATP